MPAYEPPAAIPGNPAKYMLPAHTLLWRVHQQKLSASTFCPPLTEKFGGPAFAGAYPWLAASPDRTTALAEHFLPQLKFHPARRVLAGRALTGMAVSAVRVQRDLTLLRLTTSADLAAIGQDTWLVNAKGRLARACVSSWIAWLRTQLPWADGVLWQSSVDIPRETLLLFGDRCAADCIVPIRGLSDLLDDPDHFTKLCETFRPYGVQINQPRRPSPSVFLNYRSGDGEHVLLLLHNELARRLGEAAVFKDDKSIKLGALFEPALLAAVRRCEVLLAIIGRRWEFLTYNGTSQQLLDDPADWVRREIEEAIAHDRTVVPIFTGQRVPQLDRQNLPTSLRSLASRQSMVLPPSFGEPEIRLLVDRLLRDFPRLTGRN